MNIEEEKVWSITIEVELDQSGDVEYLVEDDYPAVVGFVMFLHIGLGIVSF